MIHKRRKLLARSVQIRRRRSARTVRLAPAKFYFNITDHFTRIDGCNSRGGCGFLSNKGRKAFKDQEKIFNRRWKEQVRRNKYDVKPNPAVLKTKKEKAVGFWEDRGKGRKRTKGVGPNAIDRTRAEGT